MVRNYIKTAIRSLLKQKFYSGINIMGLAVSLCACLLIALYVRHELSYDRFFSHSDRIYKMVLERKYPNHITHYSVVPHSFAKAIQQDFPEVESTLHIFGPNKNTVVNYKVTDKEIKSFDENYFIQVDSSFLDFFELDFINGDKKTALALPNQVILSASTAEKYFGKEDPIGKVLGGDIDQVKVSGVFKDLPDNSHLKADLISSLAGPQFAQFINQENYTSFDSHTYIKLKPNSDKRILEAKFPAMVDRYAAGHIERDLGKSWEDYKKGGNGYTYTLQPLTSIHLDPTNFEFTLTPSGNIKYIYMLAFIALLIVVIACINFMNLSTARSAERAREVGIRKVMGSIRVQLIAQFLTEAIVLSFLGTLLAIAGVYLLLPLFNTLVEKQLIFSFDFIDIMGLFCIALAVGLLAGIYPAFVLSGFNPIVVMKGNFSGNKKGAWLRNGLVVFQFTISIFLIVATIIVGKQMNYMQNKDLGFDKEQVLYIKRAFALDKNFETFLNEIRRLNEVEEVAATSAMIGNRDDINGETFQPEGSGEILTVKAIRVDDEFPKLIRFELKEGRFFKNESNDSLNIVLNETAIRTMGLSDPVGRKLSQKDQNIDGTLTTKYYTVIGVVNDFHFQSLRDEITPLAIFSKESFGKQLGVASRYIAVKLKAKRLQLAIAKIEEKWQEFAPGQPFKFEFLDQNLIEGYNEEKRSGKMFGVFSGLSIIIACVGLFGLSAYTTSMRTKEIGIRKVLGASVTGVVILLSKEFTKLVIIAFGLATPIAWYIMKSWLDEFAFRIPVDLISFALAGVISLAIAWLTVSFQSIKAAIANPVKSLKGE